MRNASLKQKLIVLTFCLVFVPVVAGGALFFYNLDYFRDMALDRASKDISHQVEKALSMRAIAARSEVEGLVQVGRRSVQNFADSNALETFVRFGDSDRAYKTLKQKIKGIYRSANIVVDGKEGHLFSHLRYVGQKGKEKIKLDHGELEQDLQDRSNSDWFREAGELKSGDVYNAGVVVSSDGDAEMILASPVVIDGEFKGAVMANLRWSLARSLLSAYDFGESGYVYVLNNEGVIVSHPENDFTEKVDVSAANYGELSQIVSSSMLEGKRGAAEYTFRDTKKHMAYVPMHIAGTVYPVAATAPVSQFMAPVEKLEKRAAEIFSDQILFLLAGSGAFLVVALIAGYLFSRRISGNISGIIESLQQSSTEVDTASQQFSTSSQKLAEGSSEQASSLEETSSSLEEVAAQIKQNADNAGQADSAVKRAREQVNSGSESVERLTRAMEEIKESTSQTSGIIKTIDDIAFQTNLLALNAAVEAARAGEAGKGFAVVAEEVRNLAQRSSDAAQETSDLIQKSQSSAENGAQVASEVAENLENIKESTEQVTTLVGEISAASKEQSQGIEQVNSAVSEMDKVVQQNAADAEESSSASEELASQASELNGIVERLVGFVHGKKGAAGTSSGKGYSPGAKNYQAGTKPSYQEERIGNRVSGKSQSENRSRPDPKSRSGRGKKDAAERMVPLEDDDMGDF